MGIQIRRHSVVTLSANLVASRIASSVFFAARDFDRGVFQLANLKELGAGVVAALPDRWGDLVDNPFLKGIRVPPRQYRDLSLIELKGEDGQRS